MKYFVEQVKKSRYVGLFRSPKEVPIIQDNENNSTEYCYGANPLKNKSG